MSVVEGPSNGEDTHAPDDSVEEMENSHCSTQTDGYGDGFIVPYLTAYHLGNLDAENPGEIASSQQEPRCHHDASFSKGGTDDDNIEPYLVSYHFEVTHCGSASGPVQNEKEASLSEDHTDMSRRFKPPLRNEALRRRSNGIHEDTLQDEESTQTKEDHDTSISQDPKDHYYSSIGDHDYTYIDNTSIAGRQHVKEERGSDSVTHGLDPSQTTEPMKSTLQHEEHGGIEVKPVKATKSFDVEGHPLKVTVSTSGRIAVMFTGRRVGIYDSEGIFIMYFLTYMRKRRGETIRIFPHDVSFGTLNNNDVWIVGGNKLSHYIALYDCSGRFKYSFAIPRISEPRRLALNRLSNRAIVTETVEHRGAVKVFGLNGMLERSFGRRQGLMHPTGITEDSEDSILVLDSSTAYIYVFRDNGQFMFKFAGNGTNNGRLSHPLDICTDSSRHIIVADSGNRRVEMFTSRGEFIRHIATDVEPLSIAAGPDGQLVLTEALNKKVTILTNY
ncbi:PREDICTED: tripartite motif-containing protein 2-like [Branchiostoma belcheri]|uniref:Tripartite motif-containing protein 2-like n=1 Tax=Branchiostoma belcheri TaxID=7741 RepID=A0A6P4Y5K8_BRABE|nr:PREDICTED: tripartite motif-containing protein 2-like [Branchiostoma belcheri]